MHSIPIWREAKSTQETMELHDTKRTHSRMDIVWHIESQNTVLESYGTQKAKTALESYGTHHTISCSQKDAFTLEDLCCSHAKPASRFALFVWYINTVSTTGLTISLKQTQVPWVSRTVLQVNANQRVDSTQVSL